MPEQLEPREAAQLRIATGSTQTAEAQSEAPLLSSSVLFGPLTLMFWVLFQPSRYRAYMEAVAPGLAPDFNLCQLRRSHFHNRRLRSFLLYVLVGQPTLMLCVNIPLLFILHCSIQGLGWKTAVAAIPSTWGGNLQIACLTAFFISIGAVGAALPVGSIGTAMLQLGWSLSLPSSTLQGIGGGWEQIVGILFEFSVAYATHARLTTSGRNGTFIPSRRRVIISILAGLSLAASVIVLVRLVTGHAFGLILGLLGGGIAIALLQGRTQTPTRGITIGVALVMLFAALTYGGNFFSLQYRDGLSYVAAAHQAWDMACALLPCLLLLLPGVLSERLSGPIAGAVAGSLGGCFGWLLVALVSTQPVPPSHTVGLGLVYAVAGLLWPIWRIGLLFPAQLLITQLLLRFQPTCPSSLLPLHPGLWDEDQRLPLWGLEEHLVLLALREPTEAAELLSRIAATRQRWAAREAQLELDIRQLEAGTDLGTMAAVHRILTSGGIWELLGNEVAGQATSDLKAAVLRTFGRLSMDLQAALLQGPFHQRASLALLEERLDALTRELLRISSGTATRFLPVANTWRQAISGRRSGLVQQAAASHELESPYVVGLPLSEEQQVFIGRGDVAAQLEQLLLEPGRPPLLLYGQRRMGKTSLLRNLSRLLPADLCPLFIDLQGPASRATNHGSFLYNLAKAMAHESRIRRGVLLPGLTREALAADPFTVFEDWLDGMFQALSGRTVVLALDEFEQLEEALRTGRLDRGQVLGMLRHMVQHRPGFRILLAGAHTLHEVALWAKYLINVQTVKLGCLSKAEATVLITKPIPNFALSYEPKALEQLLWLTGGHPYLVQLLCDQVVTLKNRHLPPHRYLALDTDVSAAATMALEQASFFFADIEHNQISIPGRSMLKALAARGPGARWHPEHTTDIDTCTLLIQREILDEQGAFAIELVRRWFLR